MHYFNSGFLRTYYVLGPDTYGDAIIYMILKSLTLRFQTNLTSFYWSPVSFWFFSPFPSSSAFPSVSSLSFPAVSHSLGRGRISCSEVGWFLGGARRPASGLEPAGLPPDTRRWNPGQEEGPSARTELVARRHWERSPKGKPEWASGPVLAGKPRGPGLLKGQSTPGLEGLKVVLVALET